MYTHKKSCKRTKFLKPYVSPLFIFLRNVFAFQEGESFRCLFSAGCLHFICSFLAFLLTKISKTLMIYSHFIISSVKSVFNRKKLKTPFQHRPWYTNLPLTNATMCKLCTGFIQITEELYHCFNFAFNPAQLSKHCLMRTYLNI